jgi:hypothetical protein
MVGGRIYIRGRVPKERIGLPPPREDVQIYLKALLEGGVLTDEEYRRCLEIENLGLEDLLQLVNAEAYRRLSRFLQGKHAPRLRVEYRALSREDLELIGPVMADFFKTFQLSPQLHSALLASDFTIITVER